MSEFMRDDPRLPEDDPLIRAPVDGAATGLTIRTLNANQGAIRVAQKRSHMLILKQIEEIAQLSGDRWEYELPFMKKEGTTENVTGPTVQCCRTVARLYGNCNVEPERIEETADAWIFYEAFTDLETGYRICRPFRQRKGMKTGGYKGDTARKEDIVFLIGEAKAYRNVVYAALQDLVDRAVEAARRSLFDRVSRNPDGARSYVVDKLGELAIDQGRIARMFGMPLERLEPRQLAQLIKMLQAVIDGVATVEETFPKPEKAEPPPRVDHGETGADPVPKPPPPPPPPKTSGLPASDPEVGFGE